MPTVFAMGDPFSIIHDHAVANVNVLANDTNTNEDPLAATLISGPAHAASYSLGSNGDFGYTPQTHFVGIDSITYEASANGESSQGIITIEVGNYLPFLMGNTYTVSHDHTLSNLDLLTNASDADGDSMTIAIITPPEHGSLTQNASGLWDFRPSSNWTGIDYVEAVANDEIGDSFPATFTFNVTNSVPTAVNQSYSTQIDVPLLDLNFLADASDADNDNLRTIVFQASQHGLVTVNPDQSVNYQPEPGFYGSDSFQVFANDGVSESVPATVTITISAQSTQPDVVLRNLGTGAVRVSWDQMTTPVDLSANESYSFSNSVSGINILLLDSNAIYNLSTNGSIAQVSADVGVASVQLTVDTRTPFGYDFVDRGSIGSVSLPEGAAKADSTLAIYARGDVGSIFGLGEDTQHNKASELSFSTLTGSLTGFDHVDTLRLTGWLGASGQSDVTVEHGIDLLSAYGVHAQVESNNAYDGSDADSVVAVGAGGITANFNVGNVASFSSSGDIDRLHIGVLKGEFSLIGAVHVGTFDLEGAEGMAGMQARNATLDLLRGGNFGYSPGRTSYFLTFGRDVNLGTVTTFSLGDFSSAPATQDVFFRILCNQDFNIINTTTFAVYGRMQARNIYVGAFYRFQVSGINIGYAGEENLDYAIFVEDKFDVGGFFNDHTQMTQPQFITFKSMQAPRFRVYDGDLDIMRVGVTSWPGDHKFVGTIRVANGRIRDFFASYGLEPFEPRNPYLVYANGKIESLQARFIVNRWGTHPTIFGTSIDSIRSGSPPMPPPNNPLPQPGSITASIRSTGNIQSVFVYGSMSGDVGITDGNLELLDVFATMSGNVLVGGGDIRRIRAGYLTGNVEALRARGDMTGNTGGNIWRIEVSGEISSNVIHADNSMAQVSTNTITSNVQFILQAPGEIVMGDDGEELQVTGQPWRITVATGPFAPAAIRFTYALTSYLDPATFDFNVPAAWKIAYQDAYRLMTINDRDGNAPRQVTWTLVATPNTTPFARMVLFTVQGANTRPTVLSALFDGDPDAFVSDAID